jgi:hypothetical protein
VDDNTLLVIQKVYENRLAFIARVAGINQNIKAICSLYDAELSEAKSFMIPLHFRPKQLCLGGIKFVKSHRILGIVLGRNGNLPANHAQLLHKLRRHLIWIQIYKRQLNPKQRRGTYILYVQSILDYQLLAIWPSLNKEQRQQLTRTFYKGARFILQAPPTVDGSICCREVHIFPPAERYEILLMKRYYRMRRHEEDQLAIPSLLHALSQLDSPSGSYSSYRYQSLPRAR